MLPQGAALGPVLLHLQQVQADGGWLHCFSFNVDLICININLRALCKSVCNKLISI